MEIESTLVQDMIDEAYKMYCDKLIDKDEYKDFVFVLDLLMR